MTTVLDELRNEARVAFAWLESIVTDISPEQANWRPPGNANTIASTYAHIVRNVDEDLNQHLFERPMLNEGEWRGRNGLIPGREDWDPDMRIDWQSLRAYGRAMHTFLLKTMDALTEGDLDRDADMFAGTRPSWKGIEVIRLTVSWHVRMHGGEIACLKGIQGMKGYRAGLDADGPSLAATTKF